ncbi:hypothetical protein ACFQ9X_12095 [Catenulispora yoronensis]
MLFGAVAGPHAALEPVVEQWRDWPERSTAPLTSAIAALARVPELIRALLFDGEESVQHAQVLVRRLVTEVGAEDVWFAPLRIVLPENDHPLLSTDLVHFVRRDERNLSLLLWLTLDGRTVDTVLNTVGEYFVGEAAKAFRNGVDVRPTMTAFVTRTLPVDTGDAARVVVDYVRLLLDLSVHLSLVDGVSVDGYAAELSAFLRTGPTAHLDAEYVTELAYVAFTGSTIPSWADALFTSALTAGSPRAQETLVNAVAQQVAVPGHGDRIVSNLVFSPEFWALLRELAPVEYVHVIQAPLISALAHAAQRPAPTEDLAQTAASALAGGCTLDAVFSALGNWKHTEEPAHVCDLLERLASHTAMSSAALQDRVVLGAWGDSAPSGSPITS